MDTTRFLYISTLILFYYWLREIYKSIRMEDVLRKERFLRDYKMRTSSGELALEIYENASAAIIPMNWIYYPIYPIAPRHKLSACVIPKNMSTLLTAILCLLFNPSKWSGSRNLTMDTERSCRDSNEVHRVGQVQKVSNVLQGKWTNLMFVREPMERFLSGFFYMCTSGSAFSGSCYNCGDDALCVLRNLHEAAYRSAQGDPTAESNELWHLGPQNWHCEYFSHPDFFHLVPYSPSRKQDLARELSSILIDSQVPAAVVDRIVTEILTESTPHSTHNKNHTTVARELIVQQLRSPEGKDLLRNVFYWDYVLFGFKMPT